MEDYTSNPYVILSYEHFLSLSTENKELLTQYKGEIDEDDWRRFADDSRFKKKGPLNYVVINFLLKTTPLKREPPELIRRLTIRDWKKQILSCIDLIDLLNQFPTTEEEIFVYRGQPQYDFYEQLHEGETFVIEPFFSTTLNIEVAKNFGSRKPTHLIKLLIPKNTILPFISEKLTLTPNVIGGSESEILFPPNCRYQYMGKTTEDGREIYNIQIVEVPRLLRGFKTSFKNAFEPKSKEIYEKYYKENSDEEDGSGKKKKSKRKKKNKNTRRKRKYKQSSIYSRWI